SWSTVQHFSGVNRHQNLITQSHKTDQAQQYEQRSYRPGVANKIEGLCDTRAKVLGGLVRLGFCSDHQQADNHCDVTQSVAEKAPAFADAGYQQSADAWANRAGAIYHRRIERDGTHQIVFGYQLGDEGLTHREVECVNDSEQCGDGEDVPNLNASGQCETGQNVTKQHR